MPPLEVELPFVPSADISVYSSDFDEVGSEPLGFSLKDLLWDIDRQVFLAHTVIVAQDTPWPCIIDDIHDVHMARACAQRTRS